MEGPQTRALAEQLNLLITGKPLERIVVPEGRWQANVLLLNCVGQVIQRIRSHGKWLFLDFSHGFTWMCQLITRSKWNVMSEQEASTAAQRAKRRPLLTVYLRNPGGGPTFAAVLTGRPIFYILPTARVWAHPEIKSLGPDPLATATFHTDFPYRLRQHPQRSVAAALLDQQTVAGIGNMLKCEILYAARLAPGAAVGSLLASQIDFLAGTTVGIVATAATFASKTPPQPFPYRVYDRAGLPCNICGNEILVDHSGADAHLSWYCAHCQSLGQEPTLFS